MENEILQRLQEVESRYKRTKRLFLGFFSITLVAILGFGFTQVEKFNIIRAKGIIIEDENGRDRILIGSPIPFSKDRVRTDTTLVRKYWAKQFKNPNQYMEWYKKYKNSAEGIVFMNEKGFDVVQVGDNLSDANIGKRMFRSTGILWNTQTGWERGGAGVNTTDDGKSRPTIGLDDDAGEALHMICLEDGSKGIVIGGENGSLRIGMANKAGELFQNKGKFSGIQYFDNNGNLLWEQNIDSTTKKKK
ncbi:MAG: hypothetical protein WAZ36_07180 [Sediminibacterium sp.]